MLQNELSASVLSFLLRMGMELFTKISPEQ